MVEGTSLKSYLRFLSTVTVILSQKGQIGEGTRESRQREMQCTNLPFPKVSCDYLQFSPLSFPPPVEAEVKRTRTNCTLVILECSGVSTDKPRLERNQFHKTFLSGTLLYTEGSTPAPFTFLIHSFMGLEGAWIKERVTDFLLLLLLLLLLVFPPRIHGCNSFFRLRHLNPFIFVRWA